MPQLGRGEEEEGDPLLTAPAGRSATAYADAQFRGKPVSSIALIVLIVLILHNILFNVSACTSMGN